MPRQIKLADIYLLPVASESVLLASVDCSPVSFSVILCHTASDPLAVRPSILSIATVSLLLIDLLPDSSSRSLRNS